MVDPANIRIPFAELRPGMELGENMYSVQGRLLVSKRTVLTKNILDKLSTYNRIDPVNDDVHVVRENLRERASPREG